MSFLSVFCPQNPYLPAKEWLSPLQENAHHHFVQRGLPGRSEERWKYTDVTGLIKKKFAWAKNVDQQVDQKILKHNSIREDHEEVILLVFLNGYFSKTLSDLTHLPKTISLFPLSEGLLTHEQTLKPFLTEEFSALSFPFATLNTAYMTDGLFVSIPDHVTVTPPIHCLFLNTQQNDFMLSPRHIFHVGSHAKVTILEEYRADSANHYFTNAVTCLHLEEQANVLYHKIQSEQSQAIHIGTTFISQKKDSFIKSFSLATGSQLAREEIIVSIKERGAACHLSGFYHLTEDQQHIDTHLHIDHLASQSNSTMLYKGTLAKKSRAVFNGKVHVHQDAQHIQAKQTNHNLLLSKDAEINTKPELEIYADNVVCTHGATVGQLDNNALFYLITRGMSQTEATNILVHAFVAEVIKNIDNRIIKDYIEKRIGHHDV